MGMGIMKFSAEVFAMWNAIGPLVGVVIGALYAAKGLRKRICEPLS